MRSRNQGSTPHSGRTDDDHARPPVIIVRVKGREGDDCILTHDPALNPPKPVKYRGYGGGPQHTSLHPRHWDSAKTVTYVPGIGCCRTSEAMPYLRRLTDAQNRKGEAQLAKHAEFEKQIDVYRGSNRDEMIRAAAEIRRTLEESLASLRDSKLVEPTTSRARSRPPWGNRFRRRGQPARRKHFRDRTRRGRLLADRRERSGLSPSQGRRREGRCRGNLSVGCGRCAQCPSGDWIFRALPRWNPS